MRIVEGQYNNRAAIKWNIDIAARLTIILFYLQVVLRNGIVPLLRD